MLKQHYINKRILARLNCLQERSINSNVIIRKRSHADFFNLSTLTEKHNEN